MREWGAAIVIELSHARWGIYAILQPRIWSGMSELHDSKHEKYAGPSAPALALLEGRVYSFFAGWIGLIGGAALSGRIVEENGELVKKTTTFIEKGGIKLSPRTTLTIAGAVLGSAIMHRVGNVAGIVIGTKKSGDPEAQFNRTQSRIANLEDKVDELLARPTDASFSEREAARTSASESSLTR